MKPATIALTALLTGSLTQARDCRVLFLQKPADAPERAEIRLPEGGPTPVELPSMNLSPRYVLPDGELALTLGAPDTAAEDRLPVRIPESYGDCYLILFPNPSRDGFPADIRVIDAQADGFSSGSMLWINGTDATLSGRLGDSRLRAEPGSMTVVKPPASEQGGYPAEIGFQLPEDDRMRPLCRTVWQHFPESRQLVFVFMDPDRKNTPRLLSVEDHPRPEPEE